MRRRKPTTEPLTIIENHPDFPSTQYGRMSDVDTDSAFMETFNDLDGFDSGDEIAVYKLVAVKVMSVKTTRKLV